MATLRVLCGTRHAVTLVGILQRVFLSEQQVREFLLHLKNDRHFASTSLGIAYHGIKFF
jgi:hypothetical protein